MTCREGLERLDVELAATARIERALRLRLGQVLEILGKGKFTSLGFSSLSAYALERCEQGTRWVEIARCLARRFEALPRLREALAFGEINLNFRFRRVRGHERIKVAAIEEQPSPVLATSISHR